MPTAGLGERFTFGMIAQPHFVRTLSLEPSWHSGGRPIYAGLMSVTLGQAPKSGSRSTNATTFHAARAAGEYAGEVWNYAISGLFV